MNGMKYIAFDGPLFEEIVLFPAGRDHAAFAKMLGITKEDILGAGFVRIDAYNAPLCWGQSISLGVQARQEDTALFLRMSDYDR